MSDGACLSDRVPLQRARGVLTLGVARREGGGTALARLRQEGCLKARLPAIERGADLTAVLVNSSGGIASGDRLDSVIEAGPGASLTVTSQAAERVYRAEPGGPPAEVRTRIEVGAGARVEWLPQETILFNAARLDRALHVTLAEDAVFVGLECLLLGRAAMGERVHSGSLRDLIHIERAGEPILHDPIRIEGAISEQLASRATTGGGVAIATLVLVAPDAAMRLAALREALAGSGAEAGASCWNKLLLARIIATDGATARAAILAALPILRGGRPIPRVWNC